MWNNTCIDTEFSYNRLQNSSIGKYGTRYIYYIIPSWILNNHIIMIDINSITTQLNSLIKNATNIVQTELLKPLQQKRHITHILPHIKTHGEYVLHGKKQKIRSTP